MNNNFLLESAIKNNQVHIKNDDIIIDELFQIMEARINKDNHIVIIIFTTLNYANTDEFTSHHSNMGKYFYNKKDEIIRFMLDEEKCIHIDEKHDRLRKAIFSKR